MHIGVFIYVDCLIYKLSSIEKQETPYYNYGSIFHVAHTYIDGCGNTKDDYLDLLLDILNIIFGLVLQEGVHCTFISEHPEVFSILVHAPGVLALYPGRILL